MIKFDEWYDGLQTKIKACSSEETKENNNVECYYSVGKYIKKEIEDIQEENKKYKKVSNKIKEYVENLLKEEFEITDPDNINYGEKCQRAYFSDSELIKILELLEEIE